MIEGKRLEKPPQWNPIQRTSEGLIKSRVPCCSPNSSVCRGRTKAPPGGADADGFPDADSEPELMREGGWGRAAAGLARELSWDAIPGEASRPPAPPGSWAARWPPGLSQAGERPSPFPGCSAIGLFLGWAGGRMSNAKQTNSHVWIRGCALRDQRGCDEGLGGRPLGGGRDQAP